MYPLVKDAAKFAAFKHLILAEAARIMGDAKKVRANAIGIIQNQCNAVN